MVSPFRQCGSFLLSISGFPCIFLASKKEHRVRKFMSCFSFVAKKLVWRHYMCATKNTTTHHEQNIKYEDQALWKNEHGREHVRFFFSVVTQQIVLSAPHTFELNVGLALADRVAEQPCFSAWLGAVMPWFSAAAAPSFLREDPRQTFFCKTHEHVTPRNQFI